MKRCNDNGRFFNYTGFTLIELIGVLAIISILAAMILPNVIDQINRAVEDSEEANLKVIADGFELYIKTAKQIPASCTGSCAGGWSFNIASLIDIPESKVSVESERGCSRRYWAHPLFTPSLAYTQNSGSLISAISNNRAMIISDLTNNCANNIGSPSSAAQFLSAWDQTGMLTESLTLKIQRINIAGLFHNISFQVIPSGPPWPRFDFESGPFPHQTLSATPTTAILIQGTKLNLYDTTGTNLQLSVYITGPINFLFNSTTGNWGII